MEKLIKLLIVVVSLGFSQVMHAACVQNNNTLSGLVGLDSSDGTVYAATTSTSNECLCTNVRFVAVNTDTKMALSILLSAKMSGSKVRIDLLNETDCNSAYRVYIQ